MYVCIYLKIDVYIYIYDVCICKQELWKYVHIYTHIYIYIFLYIYYLLLSSLLLLSCVQMSSMELTSQCWCGLEMIPALSQTKDSPVIVTEVQCLHSSQEMQIVCKVVWQAEPTITSKQCSDVFRILSVVPIMDGLCWFY